MNSSPVASGISWNVRVISASQFTAGIMIRAEGLDSDGQTISVVGCKSGILGRHQGESILVALHDGTLLPAVITHIHAEHDRFRAEVDTRRLPADIEVAAASTFLSTAVPATSVIVADLA